MKKLTILVAAFALLGSNVASAQTTNSTGKAATAGKTNGSNAFAWGLGLGTLAVVGTVVGVVAATASSSSSSFSH